MSNEDKTFADDLREMMNAWDKLETITKRLYPDASKEELFQLSSAAFRQILGIKMKGANDGSECDK